MIKQIRRFGQQKRRTSRLMVRKQMHLPQIHAAEVQLGKVIISQALLQLQHVPGGAWAGGQGGAVGFPEAVGLLRGGQLCCKVHDVNVDGGLPGLRQRRAGGQAVGQVQEVDGRQAVPEALVHQADHGAFGAVLDAEQVQLLGEQTEPIFCRWEGW